MIDQPGLKATIPADGRRRRHGGALHDLREGNLRRILEVVSIDPGLSQAEVARRTGLSRATVSNLVAELRRRGFIGPGEAGISGRRPLEVASPRAGAVVGVDYGFQHVRVGVADLTGRPLGDEERALPLDFGVEESLDEARSILGQLMARTGVAAEEIQQVGVGFPAPIDRTSGQVGWHAILHRWAELDPRATLEEAFHVPAVIDNDCNLGALGELRQGAGRGGTDFVYINAGNGVGAGFILGGRLHRGAAGTAGEIGHMTVDPYGQTCRCGNRGCVDTVVGRDGFLEPLRSVYGTPLDIPEVIELAVQGDRRCQRALTDAGRALGAVVADLCNLLSPQRVIVAGPIFRAGETILEPLREAVQHRSVPAAAREAEIVQSPLDQRAEMIGATWLALEALRERASSRETRIEVGPPGVLSA
jgi:predicted NBD/HSP70 family sugar kinase/DNA-binding CsgD family transcriptional regulator